MLLPNNAKPGVLKSIDLLNQAIAQDPHFAEVYAYLAQVYWEGGWMFTPGHARTEARKNALRALELDESLSLAHAILGMVLSDYDWDYKAAEAELF